MKYEADTGAVAAMIGVQPHVIRNWAARGRIQPLRTQGNRTIYDAEAVVRAGAAAGYIPDLRKQDDDGYCCKPGCNSPTWPDMDVPLCPQHAMAVWLRVNDEWAKRHPPASQPAPSPPAVVYFIQVNDMIKIGTTTCLPARIDALSTHGSGKPEVLLVVPGGRTEEKQAHALFADERVRGEWFRPSGRLLDFIAERQDQDIRSVHGRLVAL